MFAKYKNTISTGEIAAKKWHESSENQDVDNTISRIIDWHIRPIESIFGCRLS